jgi:DNA polymerase-3 subunit alpha
MIALYRPGPIEQIPTYIHNKNHPREIKYLHPILKPILEDTYGVIVYQEQIMQLLQAIAGYTLGQAYIVLKAIAKKDRKLMAEEEPRFKQGCRDNGLTQAQADQLWDLILPFAGYSFNLSHAVLYGRLCYQTAWLKVHYPLEYMAAVLKGTGGITEDISKAVNECRLRNAAVLGPDVNGSTLDFIIQGFRDPFDGQIKRGIRFGMAAIKGVGVGPMEQVIKARESSGLFTSLEDFCARVDRSALNKRLVENLVRSGAMDSLPGTRHQKMLILEQAIDGGIKTQKNRETGQIDMFGELIESGDTSIAMIPLPPHQRTGDHEREQLAWEKELLGVTFSSNPAMQALERLDKAGIIPLARLGSTEDAEELVGKVHTFAALVVGSRRVTTKKGDTMMIVQIEDESGGPYELVAFPKSYEKCKELLVEEALLRIQAKVERDRRGEGVQLLLEGATIIDQAGAMAPPPISMVDGPELTTGQAITDHRPPTTHHRTPTNGRQIMEEPSQRQPPMIDSQQAVSEERPVEPQPSAPSAAPEPAEPVSMIRPRAKVSANGNGNGHHANGNGNGSYTTSSVPRKLLLHMPMIDDYDQAVRLMQQIRVLLEDSFAAEQGDEVIIKLPSTTGMVTLKQRDMVTCSPGLLDGLRDVLGSEAVLIEA